MPSTRSRWGVALVALGFLLGAAWFARSWVLPGQAGSIAPLAPPARAAQASPATPPPHVPHGDEEPARAERSVARPVPAPGEQPRARAAAPSGFEVRVQGSQSQPIAGARVELRQTDRSGRTTTLAEGLVDDQGSWVGPLPDLGAWHVLELRQTHLSVRATAPGHGLARQRLSPFALHGRREALVLTLRPGHVLRGRVLTAKGEAVEGATVVLNADMGSSLERPRSVRLGDAVSGREGSFEMSVERAAGMVWLQARQRSHGQGRTTSFALDGAADQDLELEPLGELSGRVVYPDGLPAAGLHVQARTSSGATRRSYTRSDATGHFAFACLDEGTYLLDVCESDLPALPDSEPVSGFTTPTREIRLTSARAGLRVRVRAPDGTLLRGVGLTCRRLVVDVDGAVWGFDRTTESTAGEPPGATFELAAGERYVVGLELAGCHPAQAAVDATSPAQAQELTLEVFTRDRSARLRARFSGWTPDDPQGVRVDVYDPFSRLCVRRDLEGDEAGWLPDLAPGPWVLRARRANRPALDLLPASRGVAITARPAVDGEVWLPVE